MFQNYLGGFITRNGSLAGIALQYDTFPDDDRSMKVDFICVHGKADFIIQAGQGKIEIEN